MYHETVGSIIQRDGVFYTPFFICLLMTMYLLV